MSEYPRLRTHTRRGASGQTWTSYFWDGRVAKVKDIPLGTDLGLAIERWKEIERGVYIKPAKEKVAGRRVVGKRRKFTAGLWDELPQWGKRMYLNAETRAATLGHPFVLTVGELAATIKRANGKCEVSGIEFEGDGKRDPFSPSVDRIDSRIGYRADNIRVVCLIVNFAMNTWGEAPLRLLAERLGGTAAAKFAEAIVTTTAFNAGASGRTRTVTAMGQGILSPGAK